MKTLIDGIYYQITPDIEVIYLNGEVITITDDGDYNWGIIYKDDFTRLHTFEVDGVTWYFTNDFQEIEIRSFVSELLPARGLELSDIEWFKTIPLSKDLYNDQFEVYYKVKGLESYHSALRHATTEEELIFLLAGV